MSFFKSVATISGWTALSRVLGFVRDVFVAKYLGASMMADSFFVALRFPNLFRSLFGEGAFNVAFVPIFTEILKEKGPKQARRFGQEAFCFMLYILLFFEILIELTMPFVMFVLTPGFADTPGKLELTTFLSRITFPFLLTVSLVTVLSGVLNSIGRFWAPAFVMVIFNVVMLLALFLLTPIIPGDNAPAIALSLGVAFSGVIELLFLWIYLKKCGFGFSLISPFKALFRLGKHMKELLRKMLPGIFGAGVYQINLFLDTFFVSFLGTGAMSWLNYANRLFQLPIAIIAVAMGTALLPVLARHIKTGAEHEAHHQLNRAIELSVLTSFASMIGLLLLAFPIVVFLFQRGQFSQFDSLQTTSALIIFSWGLPAYMLTKTLSSLFYAKGDTKTPVKIAVVSVVLNSILALSLMLIWGYKGIALATSITAYISAFQYIFRLKKENKFHLDASCYHKIPRIIFSCFLMGLFVWAVQLCLNTFCPSWLELSFLYGMLTLGAIITLSAAVLVASLLLTRSYSFTELKLLLRRS